MSEVFQLSLPSEKENVSMVRLLSSFVAAKGSFNIEQIEDLKVSVSEVLNFEINQTEKFDISVILEEDRMSVECNRGKDEKFQSSRGDHQMSCMILESLMDEVEFTDDFIRITLLKED